MLSVEYVRRVAWRRRSFPCLFARDGASLIIEPLRGATVTVGYAGGGLERYNEASATLVCSVGDRLIVYGDGDREIQYGTVTALMTRGFVKSIVMDLVADKDARWGLQEWTTSGRVERP